TNPEVMVAALAGLDPFRLGDAPDFEPRRGPGVPEFLAAAQAPLLFMPVAGGPTERVAAWLDRVGGGVQGGFSQSTLRHWMKASAPFRSFTVVRHPLHRAWSAFRQLFVAGADPDLAALIARQWAIPSPDPADIPGQRAAFAAFLRFVKASLNGQTNLRVDPSWASQSAILAGFGQFATPDMVLREATLQQGLGHLCAELGLDCPPLPGPADPAPEWLADPELERLARQAYGRDYVAFGFGDFAA
ncbi:MAG: sulfotransferase family 2 domain-containing protein, partial [Paracoccaceae bacterium]